MLVYLRYRLQVNVLSVAMQSASASHLRVRPSLHLGIVPPVLQVSAEEGVHRRPAHKKRYSRIDDDHLVDREVPAGSEERQGIGERAACNQSCDGEFIQR